MLMTGENYKRLFTLGSWNEVGMNPQVFRVFYCSFIYFFEGTSLKE